MVAHGPSTVQKMFRDRTEAMLDRRVPRPGLVLTLNDNFTKILINVINPYCTIFGCVNSFRREISRIAVLGTPSESLRTHTSMAIHVEANNVQAEHHCLQVYSWGSSILSDEFMCSCRY